MHKLRGVDDLYAGYPNLIYYSKLYNGRRVKNLDELQNRWGELDHYLAEKMAEFESVIKAEEEVHKAGLLEQSDTLRSVFSQALVRIKRDIVELEKQRDQVGKARDEFADRMTRY